MEGLKELNSPLAIISILSILFGFVMMGVDKLFYFVRGINKTTPMDRLANTFNSLDSTMKEITQNLHLLNYELKSKKEIDSIKHEQVVGEIRSLKDSISKR